MTWTIPHTETLLIWGLTIILWLIGIFFIYKNASGHRYIRRSILLGLGLCGLALIILQPHRDIELDREPVYIWTSEPSQDSLENFNNNFLSVHAFLQSDLVDKVSSVHIHGIGLEEESLNLLSGYPITYKPSTTIPGITDVDVPAITEGKKWELRGSFQGQKIKSLTLIAPDKTRHPATISDSSFQITSTAPPAGSYLIDIETVLDEADTIVEQLPIEVEHEPTWQMLILSSYPVFENKYLKNYWTSLGNGFTLRSKISKDKYNSTFVNAPQRNLEKLSRNTVTNYDYIITDIPTWNQLSSTEKTTIKSAVRNKGLALIFRPAVNSIEAEEINLPSWSEPTRLEWKTTTDDIHLVRYPIASSWAPIKQNAYTLGRYRSSGLGHIAMLSIDETYKLILADKDSQYKALWSSIFSKLYRDFAPTTKFLDGPWIWEGQKSNLTILSQNSVSSPLRLNDTLDIPYLQVPFLEGITEVSLYPSSGYNTLEVHNNEELTFYAHEKGTWMAMQQKKYSALTSKATQSSIKSNPSTYTSSKPISTYWWYLLFLVGFGGLWLDERIVD